MTGAVTSKARALLSAGPITGLASGLLAALAQPPFAVWPLAFVALVPIARTLADPALGRESAVRTGLAFGLVFYGITLHWVPATLHGMVPFGALTGGLFLAMLTGLGGAQALLLRELIVQRRVPVALALPTVLAGTELLLANLGPLSVPWTSLALSLSSAPEVGGIAELVGATGLTFWIASVNGGVAALAGAMRGVPRTLSSRIRTVSAVAGVAALAVAPAFWGVRRADRLPLVPLPPVLVAQLAMPRADLIDRSRRDANASAALARVESDFVGAGAPNEAGAPNAEERPVLAILPEAPWSSAWGPPLETDLLRLSGSLDLPLLAGAHIAPSGSNLAPPANGRRNAAILVDGDARLVHSKVRLVPGVEWPGLVAGPRGEVLEVGGLALGVLICFEVAFSSDARRYRRAGADILVNPSNDGWFRPTWGRFGSFALAQHRGHLVLRTIETRMGAVRSSVGGELLLIEPTGRASASRGAGDEGLLRLTPKTTSIVTPFVRFGDWVGWMSVVITLGSLLLTGGTGGGRGLRA